MFKKENRDLLIFSIVSLVLFVLQRVYFYSYTTGLIVSYSFIAVTSAFAIYSVFKYKESHLFMFGTIGTLVAEVFLTLVQPREAIHQDIGTTFFIFSQLGYFIFLNKKAKSPILNIIRLVLTVVVPIVIMIFASGDRVYLFSVTGIYISNLVINFIQSLKIRKEYEYLPWGFINFIFCDLLVGVAVAYEMGMIDIGFNETFKYIIYNSNVVWGFYMLSQFFLAISIKTRKELKN